MISALLGVVPSCIMRRFGSVVGKERIQDAPTCEEQIVEDNANFASWAMSS